MTSSAAVTFDRPVQPYPGLRPFEAPEWSIFFGRERMIDEVIGRLAANGLVMIHGASGSGKSSLVRAGVMPKLARQHLRHGTPWLTCAMRPSGGPLWNLATELARLEGRVEDDARVGAINGLFSRRDASLASVVDAIEALKGKSLCILVDQFEELFRFEKETSREEAELFVDLLARAAATDTVHVVVTMRSEFLGECARFAGFAEIINRTQYLVPRLDDEALLRAVRRPAQMFNGFVGEDLAYRLIARVRGREDELPLLQHSLMLMWEARDTSKDGPAFLDGAMVEAAGGLAELLSAHADRVMASVALDARREHFVEFLFRELTDVNADGSAIRRPRRFADLAAVTGATPDALRPILDAFRAPGVSFLTPYAPVPIADSTMIDISHEALIRCWRRIASGSDSWLKREFDDGLAWRSLLAEAEAFAKDKARVLSAAATKDRGELYAARNAPWSSRYGGGWPLIGGLLTASRRSAAKARRVAWSVTALLAGLLIGASTLAYMSFTSRQQAETQNELDRMLLDRITQHNQSCPVITADLSLISKAQVAAEKGNAGAYYMLGILYQCGLGVPRDFVVAKYWLEKAAKSGDLDAMVNIGLFYANGQGVAKDYAKAREWWERAAAAGDATSMHNLGFTYVNGQGVPQDYAKGRQWYEKAAAAGYVGSMLSLGFLYGNGQGVPQDYAKARQWWEQAAAAGDAVSMRNLALLYAGGTGVPQDDIKAREWYEKAAAGGDAVSMRNLGLLHADGQGVPQDYAEARQWYEKAAAAGDAGAMRNLGLIYADGRGVAQDYARAREWFEKAAAAGDIGALSSLGLLYANGQGVPRDYHKARVWLEKAAQGGTAVAMRDLGILYAEGEGVPQDYAKASQWYEKAAAAGDPGSMLNLGLFHANGQGVPRDYVKAREWYEKAAAAGDASAMLNLGLLYAKGEGVPRDYAKARGWYEKAAAIGNAGAMQTLGFLDATGLGGPQNYAKAREWYEKAAAAGDAGAMRNLGLLYTNGEGVPQDHVKALQWFEKAVAAGDTDSFGLISAAALFTHDFSRALAAAEESNKLWVQTNRAHALMFLGRDAEALTIYLSHFGEPIPESGNKLWQQVVLDDFAELRKVGLDNPLMKTVEDDFAAKAKASKTGSGLLRDP